MKKKLAEKTDYGSCFKILTYSKILNKNRGQFNLIFSQDVSKIVTFLLGVGRGKIMFTSSSIVRYDITNNVISIGIFIPADHIISSSTGCVLKSY